MTEAEKISRGGRSQIGLPGQAVAFRRMNSALRVTLHLRVWNRLEQILPPVRIDELGNQAERMRSHGQAFKAGKAAVCSRTLSIRPSRCEPLNLDGDGQADLTVHAARARPFIRTPSDHYDCWRGELPGVDLPWGMCRENFTTEGLRRATAIRVKGRWSTAGLCRYTVGHFDDTGR